MPQFEEGVLKQERADLSQALSLYSKTGKIARYEAGGTIYHSEIINPETGAPYTVAQAKARVAQIDYELEHQPRYDPGFQARPVPVQQAAQEAAQAETVEPMGETKMYKVWEGNKVVNVSSKVLAYDTASGSYAYNTPAATRMQAIEDVGGKSYIEKVQAEIIAARATPEELARARAAPASRQIDLADIREEARQADIQHVANVTGLPVGTISEHWSEYEGKLGQVSYSKLAKEGIRDAQLTGRGYVAGVGYDLTFPDKAGESGKLYSPAPKKQQLYSAIPTEEWRKLTIAAKEKEGYKLTSAYTDVSGQEVLVFKKATGAPAPAQESRAGYNSFLESIDKQVYSGYESIEKFQSQIENIGIGEFKPIKGVLETSEGASKYLMQIGQSGYGQFAAATALAPLSPIIGRESGISRDVSYLTFSFLAGAAAIPYITIKAPAYITETALAGVGVGLYTLSIPGLISSGEMAKMPQAQAEEIGARARGALAQYYATATDPGFYATTAGFVTAPIVLKAGYGFVKEKVGVLEYVDVKLGEQSTYRGVVLTKGTEAKPIIGVAEGKVKVGMPIFEEKPTNVIGSEIRTSPGATVIAEKAAFDYSSRMGLPEQETVYSGYRYAARESYPYLFEVKESLTSVLSQSQPELGGKIAEFILKEKDIAGFGLSSEVKGSTAQKMQMGAAMERPVQDIDIRTAASVIDQTGKLYKFLEPEAKAKGITIRMEGARIEQLNPETGKYYHIVEFKPKAGVEALESTGAFVEPEYIGFGLKEQAYVSTPEGVSILRLSEQLGRKASASMILQESGEFRPEAHRLKDISDATSISQFVAEEKGRPDIAKAVGESVEAMTPEMRAEAMKFSPGAEEFKVMRSPENVGEVRIKVPRPSVERVASPYSEAKAPQYLESLASPDYSFASFSESYGGYPEGSAYLQLSAPRSPALSNMASSGLSSLSAGLSMQSPGYPSPGMPSVSLGMVAPSSPGLSVSGASPSAGSPGSPGGYYYMGLARSPSYASISPSVAMQYAGKSGQEEKKEFFNPPEIKMFIEEKKAQLKMLKETRKIIARRSVLADLLSVQISQARYGIATSPRAEVGVKFEGNLFGFVPTAEMIRLGVAKEKAPRPLRTLIPPGFKGGFK